MDRKKFVSTLKLGSFDYEKKQTNLLADQLVKDGRKVTSLRSEKDLDKYNHFIVGSEVVYLNPNTPARQKNDLLNAKLLAQLHANAVAGSAENTQAWYKAYVEVLENIGFAINAFSFSKVHQEGVSLRVDKALIELLIALAADDEVDAIKESLQAIKDLEDEDGKVTIFSANANSSSGGKFQISTGKINKDKNLETTLGAYYTEKHDTRGNFLWFTWGSLTFDVWFSGQKIELDEEIYSDLREEIKKKVGDKAINYIKGLDI